MALNASRYQAYLRSPEWRVLRRVKLDVAHHRCELCNTPDRLNVHHRSYDRLGQEVLGDLTVLCEDCHSKFHDKLPATPDASTAIDQCPSCKCAFGAHLLDCPLDTPDDGLPLGPDDLDLAA